MRAPRLIVVAKLLKPRRAVVTRAVGAAAAAFAAFAGTTTSARADGSVARHEIALGIVGGAGLAAADPDRAAVAAILGFRGEYGYRLGYGFRVGGDVGMLGVADLVDRGTSLSTGTFLGTVAGRWALSSVELGPRLGVGLAAGKGEQVGFGAGWAFDVGLEVAGRSAEGLFFRGSLSSTKITSSHNQDAFALAGVLTFGGRWKL